MAAAPLHEWARAAGGRCASMHRPGKFRRLATMAVAGLLAGCAATGPAPRDAVLTDPGDDVALPPPRHALTGSVLYKLLVAEIAGQRGDLPLAVESYLEVARDTRDPAVAARAARIAVFSGVGGKALEAAHLWGEIDPSSVEARQALASLLIRAGDLDAAVGHLAAIVEMMPDPPGAGVRPRRRPPCRGAGQESGGRRDEAADHRARGRRGGAARACPASHPGRAARRGGGSIGPCLRARTRRCAGRNPLGARAPAPERHRRGAGRAGEVHRARPRFQHRSHGLRANARRRETLRAGPYRVRAPRGARARERRRPLRARPPAPADGSTRRCVTAVRKAHGSLLAARRGTLLSRPNRGIPAAARRRDRLVPARAARRAPVERPDQGRGCCSRRAATSNRRGATCTDCTVRTARNRCASIAPRPSCSRASSTTTRRWRYTMRRSGSSPGISTCSMPAECSPRGWIGSTSWNATCARSCRASRTTPKPSMPWAIPSPIALIGTRKPTR